jgi:hypothetical protein
VALAAYLPGSGDEAWALGTASVSTVPPGLMLSGACNLSVLRYPPSIVSPPIRPCRWRTITSRSGVHRGRERDP